MKAILPILACMTLLPAAANAEENTKYETTLKDETGKNTNARSSVEANLSGTTLSVEGSYNYLGSNATEIRLTSEGAKDAVCTLKAPFDSTNGPWKKWGDCTLTPAQVQALKDGKLSVVINTLERPQGEVRGVIPSKNAPAAAAAPAPAAAPAKTEEPSKYEGTLKDDTGKNTNAKSNVEATLTGKMLALEGSYNYLASNATEIVVRGPGANDTACTLEAPFASTNGPWKKWGECTLTDAQAQALKDGKLSVVINTLERPQGEVRGSVAVKK